MAKREIDKWTFGYFFLQTIWARSNFLLYYKRIGIFNKKKVPKKTPIIIAPNHQNALMDALAIVTLPPEQRIFLTRADVFNKPLIERILNFLKMLPIFRIRDGRSSLAKNDEIFETAVKILHNKKSPLCMFPEGNHGEKRRLRPLVKGIFRIAFMAQEKFKDQPGVKIIPTGIDYEHYQKFGKEQLVIFGDPIEVSEYWKEHEENPASATNALKDRLSEEMRKVMIDIQTDEYYDTYMELRAIYRPELSNKLNLNPKNQLDKFKTDKKLIDRLNDLLEKKPEQLESIHKLTGEYCKNRDRINFREWLFAKNTSLPGALLGLIVSIVFLPVFLFGLINNWPNFFIPIAYSKKIKDPQFRSTASFGLGLVLQIVYYPILIVLACIFLPALWMKLLFIPLLPISGYISWNIWKLFIKNWHKLRFNVLKSSEKLKQIIALRSKIISKLNNQLDESI